ncbi:MAG: ankyrin repeat domain-containing protein [Planctomycetota bacterium]
MLPSDHELLKPVWEALSHCEENEIWDDEYDDAVRLVVDLAPHIDLDFYLRHEVESEFPVSHFILDVLEILLAEDVRSAHQAERGNPTFVWSKWHEYAAKKEWIKCCLLLNDLLFLPPLPTRIKDELSAALDDVPPIVGVFIALILAKHDPNNRDVAARCQSLLERATLDSASLSSPNGRYTGETLIRTATRLLEFSNDRFLYEACHHLIRLDLTDQLLFIIDCNDLRKVTDQFGHTLLHWASGQWPSTVSTLIAHGWDVNARDEIGETPVHHAGREAQPQNIELLVQAGADLDARDKDGIAAREYFERYQ